MPELKHTAPVDKDGVPTNLSAVEGDLIARANAHYARLRALAGDCAYSAFEAIGNTRPAGAR